MGDLCSGLRLRLGRRGAPLVARALDRAHRPLGHPPADPGGLVVVDPGRAGTGSPRSHGKRPGRRPRLGHRPLLRALSGRRRRPGAFCPRHALHPLHGRHPGGQQQPGGDRAGLERHQHRPALPAHPLPRTQGGTGGRSQEIPCQPPGGGLPADRPGADLRRRRQLLPGGPGRPPRGRRQPAGLPAHRRAAGGPGGHPEDCPAAPARLADPGHGGTHPGLRPAARRRGQHRWPGADSPGHAAQPGAGGPDPAGAGGQHHRGARRPGHADPGQHQGAPGLVHLRPDGLHAGGNRPRPLRAGPAAPGRPLPLQSLRLPRRRRDGAQCRPAQLPAGRRQQHPLPGLVPRRAAADRGPGARLSRRLAVAAAGPQRAPGGPGDPGARPHRTALAGAGQGGPADAAGQPASAGTDPALPALAHALRRPGPGAGTGPSGAGGLGPAQLRRPLRGPDLAALPPPGPHRAHAVSLGLRRLLPG